MFARSLVVAGLATAAVVGAGLGSGAVAQPQQSVGAEAAPSFEGAQGTFQGHVPYRMLDTRTGNGAPKGLVGPGGEISLLVAGRHDIPSGISAVVLNLAAVGPSATTFLTAYPSGDPRPLTSNLNVVAGQNRANMVTVPVGSDGRVRIYNSTGTTHVLADVIGYYHGQVEPNNGIGVGAQYYTVDPERIFDSRSEGGALAPGEDLTIWLDFGPEDDVTLATNITVLGGSRAGFLSAGSSYTHEVPTSSTINYGQGQTIANMSIGSSGVSEGKVGFSVRNGGTGTVQVVIDLVGFYEHGQSEGLRFRPLAPARIIDTRSGVGGPAKPLGSDEARLHTAPTAVAGVDTYALVANTTVVRPTATTYVTAYDNDLPKPGVSNVNAARGEVAANSTFVPLGFEERFRVHNAAGQAPAVMDVFGTFEYHADVSASRSTRQARLAAAGDMTRSGPASVRVERG